MRLPRVRVGRRSPVLAAVVALAGLAAGLAGCAGGSTPNRTASALFSDVDGLIPGAQVQMADIPVGTVTSISLDDNRALVTMSLSPAARVPDNVTAELDLTTLLGDRYVDLAVPATDSGRAVPRLPDGARIQRTSVVPDIEQLISSGSQFFGAVSTSDLAQIIEAGGQGFTGQAADLRQLLNNLAAVTAGYAQHTAQITTVVDSMDQLASSLAPSSGNDAEALTNLSHTVAVLAQQSTRFDDLLSSLNGVSEQGRSLLENYYPQISDQIKALAAVSAQVADRQQALAGLLQELPLHNQVVSSAVRQDYAQVLNNVIVCGIPGGGEESTAPAFTCQPKGSGG